MKRTLGLLMVVGLLTVGCGGDDDPGIPDANTTPDANNTPDGGGADAADTPDAGPASAVVTANSTSFAPTEVTIQAGETVRWMNGSGSHTVTSGTGAGDPNAGQMFDSPLSAANPTFDFTFTTPGTYDYFCRPHEGLGMKGKVIVQ